MRRLHLNRVGEGYKLLKITVCMNELRQGGWNTAHPSRKHPISFLQLKSVFVSKALYVTTFYTFGCCVVPGKAKVCPKQTYT